MGLFNTIINTAKELYEADSNGKLNEYVTSKVSGAVRKIDGSDAKEREAQKDELLGSINRDLERDTFDNERFQRKVDRYIREFCSTEDDLVLAYHLKSRGWGRVFNTAWDSLCEHDWTSAEDAQTLRMTADEANENILESLKSLEENLTEDNIQNWFCWLCCARSERLHWMNNHVEAVRLAIQGLPYACDENEKIWAKSLVSGKDYNTEQSIRSKDGGYGVIIDKTFEESVAWMEKFDAFSYDEDKSWEDNEEMLELCGDELLNDIQTIKDNFLFSYQPYHNRQFIFTVRDIEHIGGCYDETDNIKYVFPLDEVPKDISFPMGHPQANTLYYAHPLRPVYLPFENAQLTLFYEKIQEMCRLFQCLGATKISARCLKGDKISSNVMTSYEVNAEGGYKVMSGSGEFKGQSGTSSNSEARNEMFLTQTFSPYKAPYCPSDLVWTKNDPELLSLIKQRMEGGLLDFTKRVSSYETSNISQNLIADVKVAFQHLIGNVSANYSASTDATFSSIQETEWEISVEFKPLDELPSVYDSRAYSEQDLVMQIDKFAYIGRTMALGTIIMDIEKVGQPVVVCDDDTEFDSELEHIVMFGKILDFAEKGDRAGLILKGVNSTNIHKGAKIYLKHPDNQITESPQITESAEEVKNDNVPELLNPNEERYKEEIMFCLEDGGSISDDDRKYLERKRIKFGISPERAAEIENSCAPQLSASEKEYIETFKEMTDGKEITERIRRILERERESLGITKERAEELEKIQ